VSTRSGFLPHTSMQFVPERKLVDHSFNFSTMQSAYPMSTLILLDETTENSGPLDLVTLSTYIRGLEDSRTETDKPALEVSFPFLSSFVPSLTCLSSKRQSYCTTAFFSDASVLLEFQQPWNFCRSRPSSAKLEENWKRCKPNIFILF
jgi:hypothetical protein